MTISYRSIGPDGRHPMTGVLLNPYAIRRKSFTFDDAVTIWIMRLQCEDYVVIQHFMGACSYRIAEVLSGEVHPDAKNEAIRRLTC